MGGPSLLAERSLAGLSTSALLSHACGAMFAAGTLRGRADGVQAFGVCRAWGNELMIVDERTKALL